MPRLRLALVGRKAADAGLTLDDEVAAYLAEHWCKNGRQLEGVLRRIEAFGELAGKAITLGLVREALALFRVGPNGPKSVGRIVGEVCRQFQVTRSELRLAARTARVSLPRQVAMYFCRRHTDASLGVIGEELGGRDHSTVVHALGAIEARLQRDAGLRATVSLLEAGWGDERGGGGVVWWAAPRRREVPAASTWCRGRLGGACDEALRAEGRDQRLAVARVIHGDFAQLIRVERLGKHHREGRPENGDVHEHLA